MPSKALRCLCWFGVFFAAWAAQAQDLLLKKNISVGGNSVSTTEVAVKGSRERTVNHGPSGTTITLRQCDLKRTVTLNEQEQTYLVTGDPIEEKTGKRSDSSKAEGATEPRGGKITVTTTVTDTGEHKMMYGYQARHLKAKVTQEPSQDACTQVRQSFEIDGWFADISTEQTACATIAPPVRQGNGCADTIVAKRVGRGKLGYPLQEDITLPAPDGSNMTMTVQVSELAKQTLPAELFEVPAGYRQITSLAELNGSSPQTAVDAQGSQMMGPPMPQPTPQGGSQVNTTASTVKQGMLNPMAAPAANQAALGMMQQQMRMAQSAGFGGMPQMMGASQPSSTQVAAPQALGPKAPGKIRIGVASPDAQLGQGNNAGADYSTPIRNAEIALMSGPAIEIAALDSRVAIQLQAEAQQKQCDYILFSAVAVKHGSGGAFGKFAKFGGVAASMTPMGAMAKGMGGAVAASAASAAASAAAQAAQQQALSQLAGFNGQIKSKDEVTVQYQLIATGQTAPVVQNSLNAKAKADGEDVLTPLLQHTASDVLGAVSKK